MKALKRDAAYIRATLTLAPGVVSVIVFADLTNASTSFQNCASGCSLLMVCACGGGRCCGLRVAGRFETCDEQRFTAATFSQPFPVAGNAGHDASASRRSSPKARHM